MLTLTVDDGMDVLRLVAGYDSEDLFSKTEARYCNLSSRTAPKHFRFALPRASALEFFGDADAARLFEDAIARMEKLGGTAVEIDYSIFMETQRLLYEGPFLAERSASVAPVIAGHEEALYPVTRTILESASEWTARDMFKAHHRLAELKRDARRLLASVDFFLVPTTPTIYRVNEIEADPIVLNARLGTYTNFVNLMGYCGAAVPSGFRTDGLPLGVTIIAAAFAEAKVAAIASAFHRSTGLPLGAPCDCIQ